MKKLILLMMAVTFAVSASAYEKGTTYVAPLLGYHFFDSEHDLDDSVEAGIRLGGFLADKFAAELELDLAPTEEDHGSDNVNAVTAELNLVKYFEIGQLKPYFFFGVGGMLHDDTNGLIAAGVGAAYPVYKNMNIDFRVKDMFMTGSRNDIVPSVGLSFLFGGSKPAVKEEPAAEPAPAAAVEEKKPVDSDGDGVFDDADKCPGTPAGAAVDADGCCLDSDGDGVKDYADKCPATPAGAAVNADGCCLDSDGDGIYDYMDKCPGTIKGVKVSAEGCFEALTLNVNFKTNSAEIEDGYDSEIKAFANYLVADSGVKIEIQGHTDSKGSASYNKKLSQRRAESVMKELVKYGVSADRMTAVGYGEEQPIVPNDTPENMFKNRRIETVVR
ncbi:MAG: OmpA family protein [Deferribacterales bacterium]